MKSILIPRTSGRSLKILLFLIRLPIIKNVFLSLLLRQAGLKIFRKFYIEENPIMSPNHFSNNKISNNLAKKSITEFFDIIEGKNQREVTEKKFSPENSSLFKPESAIDFRKAYLEGRTNPVNVAMRFMDIIRSLEESAVPLKPFVAWDEKELISQAKASSERYKRGESKGILDGVPIAVKDELDMLPFRTMVGTKFYNKIPPKQDSTVVERLRTAGALMVGKTNMHEMGMGVTGLNTKCGTTRNPHHLDHYPGGSSSGSAASVSAGLCPISLGLDGGGSIRIPASLCGVVGLKTTWGRISSAGSAPISWSLSTVGPIASTVNDIAIAYSHIAGKDDRQIITQNQPDIDLQNYFENNFAGLKLGIFSPWYNHATKEIINNCDRMLDKFKAHGIKIKEIEIPNLNETHISHLVTIGTEMLTSVKPYLKFFSQPFGLEVFLNLILAREFTGSDYVKAQRVRAQLIKNISKIFMDVDAIVTPSTAITAPPIMSDSLTNGESDLKTLTELMRFSPEANLGGFPAITFPVGYDNQGLPVGMQLIGRPWEESTLLRLAKFSENIFVPHPPMMRFSLLPT